MGQFEEIGNDYNWLSIVTCCIRFDFDLTAVVHSCFIFRALIACYIGYSIFYARFIRLHSLYTRMQNKYKLHNFSLLFDIVFSTKLIFNVFKHYRSDISFYLDSIKRERKGAEPFNLTIFVENKEYICNKNKQNM